MALATSLAAILRDEDVVLDSPIGNKAALFVTAAERLSQSTGIASEILQKALEDREKLGSTAINRGIAVPHAGIEGLAAPAAVFYRLPKAIEFGASDNNPVDLVFVFVWPSDKTSGLLATLGGLCRTLRTETLVDELRDAPDRAEIRSLFEGLAARATSSPPQK